VGRKGKWVLVFGFCVLGWKFWVLYFARRLRNLGFMPDVHHETVFFTGHVQGVGFRYSVLQVAKEFEVTGFVSNLADGRVQLEAEGQPADVSAFVDAVQEKMHGYIRKMERSNRKRPAQFSGFVIR
jgi:acylphosphatase